MECKSIPNESKTTKDLLQTSLRVGQDLKRILTVAALSVSLNKVNRAMEMDLPENMTTAFHQVITNKDYGRPDDLQISCCGSYR
jgi:hypothetical protein